jgi:hypothetical protein
VVSDKNSPYSQKLIEDKTTKQGVEKLSVVEMDKATNNLKKQYKKANTEGKADKGADIRAKIIKRAAR